MSLNLLFAAPIPPNPRWLITAMIAMLGTLLLLIGFIVLYLLKRNRQTKHKTQWRNLHDQLIQRAIYWEGTEGPTIPIPFRTARSLRHPVARQVLIGELLQGKKALSGSAATNLVHLYEQLALDQDSVRKLKNPKWHLCAQGIQELAVMEQRRYVTRIYRLTNASNNVVRTEAQAAIVQLYGVEGLRFLDVIDLPLSEWQQIQLLRLLARSAGKAQDRARGWLGSPNASVRIFTLKLIAEQHWQELTGAVEARLDDDDPAVRLQAIRCLRELGAEGSSVQLIHIYASQDTATRHAILDTLGHLGTSAAFLGEALYSDNDRTRLEAARALLRTGADGKAVLERFPLARSWPWNEIIQQAKTEWSL